MLRALHQEGVDDDCNSQSYNCENKIDKQELLIHFFDLHDNVNAMITNMIALELPNSTSPGALLSKMAGITIDPIESTDNSTQSKINVSMNFSGR